MHTQQQQQKTKPMKSMQQEAITNKNKNNWKENNDSYQNNNSLYSDNITQAAMHAWCYI